MFLDLARKRYSLRSFLIKEIEREKLEYVVEAARYAPSACNLQPVKFYVVTDKDMLSKIHQAYPREWFKKAPCVIVAVGDRQSSWKRADGKDHVDVDVAISVDHLTLAASDVGLGTCWVCAFDAKLCHEILNLPVHMEAIALIPIGYPEKEEVKEKRRKSLDEIVEWI
jgi:nitroreductase